MLPFTKIKLSGQFAYLVWKSVYITKQVSFRNRVLILFDWVSENPEWGGAQNPLRCAGRCLHALCNSSSCNRPASGPEHWSAAQPRPAAPFCDAAEGASVWTGPEQLLSRPLQAARMMSHIFTAWFSPGTPSHLFC